MSALAKPFVKSTTCTTPHLLVPVEKIISMDKLTIVNTNGVTLYYNIFVVDTLNSAPREIKLAYTTSALRDASFTAIETVITTSGV